MTEQPARGGQLFGSIGKSEAAGIFRVIRGQVDPEDISATGRVEFALAIAADTLISASTMTPAAMPGFG